MSLLLKGAVFGACTALTLALGIGGAELYHRAHPVQRIIETHTVERIAAPIVKAKIAKKVHAVKAKVVKKRLPGDDIADELNRLWK